MVGWVRPDLQAGEIKGLQTASVCWGLWTLSVTLNCGVPGVTVVPCLPFLQASIQRRKKPASQKKRRFKTHNEHLAGVLKDYSDITPGK